MKIYTSYYKHFEQRPDCGIPVRISTSLPSWFPFWTSDIPELYPGWDLVKGIKDGTLDWEDYTNRYNAKLATLDRDDILNRLQEISDSYGGRDIILLCYEAKDKPCHRHLVAKWLDCDVEELK